jgi:alkanesulfonate monooxygenase SsuD/methylene tetrahydromethanopterin reductase-like flavin-dependent oxidoreductase (luciferase family)
MKLCYFALNPHRDLPDDFEQRYHSVWADVPWRELGDARRFGDYFNWTLDEHLAAARAGADGLCSNEHHQNAYGCQPNPSLIGAILARATNGTDVGIVQIGSTLPTTSPPIRIAEEYAMLDCISGGRLVAGMPLGLAMDANMAYGIPPIEQRGRYREAHDLIKRAWTAEETFAWNGRYWQLPMVNLWPRPIQQPHPPIWIPGGGSSSTWDFVAENDYCYCFLSYFGNKIGAKKVVDRYWEALERKGRDRNPYRLGFLQLVTVAETDARAEADYARHVEYFYHKGLHIPFEWWLAMPGQQDYRSLLNSLRQTEFVELYESLKKRRYRDFVDDQFVIAGSPATVRDQLLEAARSLRIGNLMVLLQIGSMPHDLTLKNIDLFFREVAPHLRNLWDDEWENRWWPAPPMGGARHG